MKRLREQASQVSGGSFGAYLRMFQELDAHSVYHHLREIPHPTLLISGSLDPLTPAYQSREMLRKMPNARQVRFPLGTHFVLLEYPQPEYSLIVSERPIQIPDLETDAPKARFVR